MLPLISNLRRSPAARYAAVGILVVVLFAIGYVAGSCVNAEAVSHTVLNLPTHPKVSLDDVGLIIKLIRSYVHH